MVTYPLTFPTTVSASKDSTWRIVRIIGESASIFTGSSQYYRHQGEWWEGELVFPPMSYAESAEMKAFFVSLRGKLGSFHYGDPDALVNNTLGSGGTILVNGASQTGNDINVDGMTANAQNVLKKGDYFQINSGSTQELKMVTQTLNADGSGEGVLSFEPKIRTSPSDNEQLVLNKPMGLFGLSSNIFEWDSDQAQIAGISVPIKERLTV